MPAKGALKGLLLEKKDEKGKIPSLPSSWMTEFEIRLCYLDKGKLVTDLFLE